MAQVRVAAQSAAGTGIHSGHGTGKPETLVPFLDASGFVGGEADLLLAGDHVLSGGDKPVDLEVTDQPHAAWGGGHDLTASREGGGERVGGGVVVDEGPVAVPAAVAGRAVVRRGVAIAVQADEDEAGFRVAGGGEDQALLVQAGRVPSGVFAGVEGEERELGGEEVAGLHTAMGGGRIDLGEVQ